MVSTETPQDPSPIRVVAVLGAGTMGHGIAQVAAASGLATRLFDVAAEADPSAANAAKTDSNRQKNRYVDILPCESAAE